MTIGIGFSADDGFGLLTDSMYNFASEDGKHLAFPGSRKYCWLPSVRSVAVVSGSFRRDVETICSGIQATTVEQAAGQLFREAEREAKELEASWPAYKALDLGKGGKSPEVLIVGGHDLRSLRLGVLTPVTQQWIPAGDRAVIVIGAWTKIFETLKWLERPPPATLQGWLERAIYWGRIYIEMLYQGRTLEQMMAEGLNPTVSYPLYAITFDLSGAIREYVIDEKSCVLAQPEVMPA